MSSDAESHERVTGPRSYIPSIEAKYGKPIDAWFEELRPHADAKHMEQVAHLKSLGIGHGHANAIVHLFRAEPHGN